VDFHGFFPGPTARAPLEPVLFYHFNHEMSKMRARPGFLSGAFLFARRWAIIRPVQGMGEKGLDWDERRIHALSAGRRLTRLMESGEPAPTARGHFARKPLRGINHLV
jgi:hypothetical protein